MSTLGIRVRYSSSCSPWWYQVYFWSHLWGVVWCLWYLLSYSPWWYQVYFWSHLWGDPWCLEHLLGECVSLSFVLILSSNIIHRSFMSLSHTLRLNTQSRKLLHLLTLSTHWNDQDICSTGKSFILSLWLIYWPHLYSFSAWSHLDISILTVLVYPIVTYQSLSTLPTNGIVHSTISHHPNSFGVLFHQYILVYPHISMSIRVMPKIQLFTLSTCFNAVSLSLFWFLLMINM